MINLLDQFALTHTQVTRLHADLTEVVPASQRFSAKVELKLTPREYSHDGELPQYQVSAHLVCRGHRDTDTPDNPLFTIELVLQAVYRQFQGDPVDFERFKANHGSLTRQLYPLIHHQLQPVFKQFGLDQVKLPYDLAGAPEQGTQRQVH
ncbi:MAG: hypothetical protein GVY32_12610 [Gammaproteobacteria bacterium]|jgi:hypothetical protein|nr:hypothetical protein [Gammaproteobacteria bacterium]